MSGVTVFECGFRLRGDQKSHEAPSLREFFGAAFAEQVYRHSHTADGELLHHYPRIQFKLIDSSAVLLGIDDGADLVKQLWTEVNPESLGGERHQVTGSWCDTREERLESTADPVEYRFATPWLALNQKNFQAYTGSRNTGFRKDELSRILVGNCLGMAKSLEMRLVDHIQADGRRLTSIKTSVNGQGMIAFVGRFTINANLPNLLGLGKSVARGFGAVSRG